MEVQVLTRYLAAAIKRATFKTLDDGVLFGEIPGFEGVWATAAEAEACRAELEEVLEEWILVRVSRHLPVPEVDGLTLQIRDVA